MSKNKMILVGMVGSLALSTGVVVLAKEDIEVSRISEEVTITFDGAVSDGEDTVVDETSTDVTSNVADNVEKNKEEKIKEEQILESEEVKEETKEVKEETKEEISEGKTEKPSEVVPALESLKKDETASITSEEVLSVVEEVPFVPIQKEDGSTIIGTNQGQIVVESTDGTLKMIAPEEVGAKVTNDGKVYVSNKEGKMTRLPETGSAEIVSMTASLSGIFLMLYTAYLKFKKKVL